MSKAHILAPTTLAALTERRKRVATLIELAYDMGLTERSSASLSAALRGRQGHIGRATEADWRARLGLEPLPRDTRATLHVPPALRARIKEYQALDETYAEFIEMLLDAWEADAPASTNVSRETSRETCPSYGDEDRPDDEEDA